MDYGAVGLKVGLEWHQRLDTHKLFCNCPSEFGAYPPSMKVERKIRASMSELGEFDPAALVEHVRSRGFTYRLNPESACLVELDETPPAPFNIEAVKICLEIALLFKMRPVDEIRCMRKTVIDGSNTTGFQRTMLVATGTPDSVIYAEGPVGLKSICLEEESAFIIEAGVEKAEYRLDRLGIPLVEIATLPQITSPNQARKVAERVGTIMRMTGKVQRGLGTIRQDINVSIREGSRQEIKGVQELELIPLIIEREVERQVSLLKLRDKLKKRGIEHLESKIFDVSNIFKNTENRVLKSALEKNQRILAAKLEGFSGLVGVQIQPGRRFGTELSDYARVWGGVEGIFHSDELPGYGISELEVDEIGKILEVRSNDAFVIVAGPEKRARAAIEAVIRRANLALSGVPEETRRPLPNGNTAYMRPLPGAARMYPETDVPPFVVTKELLEEVSRSLPPMPEERLEKLVKEHGLSRHLAEQLVNSPSLRIYESIVSSSNFDRTAIASTLLNTIPFLRREGLIVERLDEEKLKFVFKEAEKLKLSREEVEEVLTILCKEGLDVESAAKKIFSARMSEEKLRERLREIVKLNSSILAEKGKGAIKPLMGIAMKELRGRASGSEIHRILIEEISRKIEEE
ncbi:MAG: Glu-tRNA(Gln) amidotransferase subunit GatE [Thermoproteota archaeon]